MAALRDDEEVRGLLARLTGPRPPAFAVLCREGDHADVLVGETTTAPSTADIPIGPAGSVALLPFRLLAERGLPCRDDGAPLRVLVAAERHLVPRAALERVLPAGAEVVDARFDEDDESYATRVRELVAGLRDGGVAHCLLRRGFTARLRRPGPASALALLGGLLRGERGAYWTFAVHEGGPDGLALVGAPPQGQVRLAGGEVVLRPVCGTYHHPKTGPTVEGLVSFLRDDKEFGELVTAVDAELAALCALEPEEIRVEGPLLLPMSRLTHTGCVLRATGVPDARRALAGTMFAATAIGSPLAGALRLLAEREPDGRGHYGGAVALLEPDGSLDAATLIRTAEVEGSGRVRVSVGATVGADSSPAGETAETRVKVDALLAALRGSGAGDRPAPPARPEVFASAPVLDALDARRRELAPHWTRPAPARPDDRGPLLVVDLGDQGAAALAHLARLRGWRPVVRAAADVAATGLGAPGATVLLGPGPGRPDDRGLDAVRGLVGAALREGREVRGVGLGFQVLARLLGFGVAPRRGADRPGAARVFGVPNEVLPHNGFAVTGPAPDGVEAHREGGTGEVLALRGRGAAGVRSGPESVAAAGGAEALDALLRLSAR
ncbi:MULTISPECIES: chorismate-binding protein [Actinosynnema]|uniref:chorismate-binding protein n=1 Tax=Actinosynnema TaxID=40566 RepID=UPI0020A4BCFA|nr:chorismate-binding protein [Actinosynnema pretiosum]MCP2097786.1 phenazine biosynthesis protein phzE [Actinosynnema pretiosum]